MSSREIAELTGKDHKNVLRTLRGLIEQNLVAQIEPLKYEYRGQYFDYFNLDKRDSLVLVARLSPEFTAAIVDRWQKLESAQPKPMTQLEVLAGLTSAMVEQERKQLEQAKVVAAIESKLEQVEAKVDSQIWDECPPNAEAITTIRRRINQEYGIPHWAINEIVQGDYGPRPAGQVRNTHENANGQSYVVYWRPSISRLFKRVYDECEGVTNTLVKHSYVSKRIKLVVL